MSIYVFLGPTLPVETARGILDAEYLPPAKMGDVYRLMERQPRTIAIIDGLFERVPAVWHKEILYAISQGVRVLGASSMGALRAAELCAFGMEGVGRIFEAYRDGVLEDDDEVAVDHAAAEFGYRQVSEPMVNVRDVVRQALEGGLIGQSTVEAVLTAAKRMFYPERSWPAIGEAAAALGLPADEWARLLRFVREEKPNLKRDDAIELLRHLASEAPGLPPRPFHFQANHFWHSMRKHLETRAADFASQ